MKTIGKKRIITYSLRYVYLIVWLSLFSTQSVYAYIDPGTGSMLFTVIVGVLGAGFYNLRKTLTKLRFWLSGGNVKHIDNYEKFVIFSDHKRYWNVFRPICEEFEKRKVNLTYLTASEDDPALETSYNFINCRYIGEGNRAFAKANTMKAGIVLSTTPSLDVYNWKRSKGVEWYVHIPHAVSDLTLYRMFGIDYYDAILTSGDFQKKQVRELERVRGLPEKEIVKVGLTYMDNMRKRWQEEERKTENEITVLLAPSWGPNSIFNTFGRSIIEALLGTGYKIIIRPHPQSYTSEKILLESLMNEFSTDSRIEWNNDNDNFDVLNKSSILISDFSGIIFDYCLVFDKPVIYTKVHFDKAPYDACWLEEQPWTFSILPFLGEELTKETLPEIKKTIDCCLEEKRYQEGRNKARVEAWAYTGESIKRTADYLINKYEDLHKTEPGE